MRVVGKRVNPHVVAVCHNCVNAPNMQAWDGYLKVDYETEPAPRTKRAKRERTPGDQQATINALMDD